MLKFDKQYKNKMMLMNNLNKCLIKVEIVIIIKRMTQLSFKRLSVIIPTAGQF